MQQLLYPACNAWLQVVSHHIVHSATDELLLRLALLLAINAFELPPLEVRLEGCGLASWADHNGRITMAEHRCN